MKERVTATIQMDGTDVQRRKETEIRPIPRDWQILGLADAVEYIDYGISAPIPKTSPPDGVKIVSTAELTKTGRILYGNIRRLVAPARTVQRLTLKHGDVLFNWRNSAELIGKSAVFEEQSEPHVFASFILRIRCDEVRSHNMFLSYLMNYYREQGVFVQLSRRAVNQANYNRNEISVLPIPLPPLEEQRQIAKVLSMVQRAIVRQERLLGLAAELKKALMHKFFTEGTSREQLKQTEIGRMPESWEIVTLGSLAKIGNGSTPKRNNAEYWDGGTIPWLTSGKIHESRIKRADEYVTGAAKSKCHLPLVTAGSLLIAITGEGKTLGNAAMIEFDTCVSQHLAYVQFHVPNVVPAFLLYFLQHQYNDLRRLSVGAGSTKKALTCGMLKRYLVPLPRKCEQDGIVAALDAVVAKMEVHRRIAASLKSLFSSTLHQLMTAQVRIHELDVSALGELEAEQAEVA